MKRLKEQIESKAEMSLSVPGILYKKEKKNLRHSSESKV